MTDAEHSPTFEAYVAARGPALLRFGYVLSGDRHLSEDLVQEGLARAHRRWAKISALDHPDAYVRRIMVNEFLSWKRRLSSRLNVVVDPQVQQARDSDGSDHAAAQADREAMWQLLASLPRAQWVVLVLRYYEDWTDEQIAEQLRCRPVTVRSHASKALARLRGAAATSSILNGA